MREPKHYFFCGIGGSGMLPLALIVRARGDIVSGSDRALDQGRLSAKFDYLRAQGIALFPQDGSGVTRADQIVVASAAVEDTVPDMLAANRVGATVVRRANLLAELFNAARLGIAVGGTSGKSTVTAMLGWIFFRLGQDPTIVNGAVMNNFIAADAPFASAVVGRGEAFIAEVDESDGSIALYQPAFAVLNNLALDHKSMEELRALFGDFVRRAAHAVINIDNAEAAALAEPLDPARIVKVSVGDARADFWATDLQFTSSGIAFAVHDRQGSTCAVQLRVPGAHNVSNAMMAIGTACQSGLALDVVCAALNEFSGVRRRLEIIGAANGVIVIDDFAHNPDKITATLAALHAHPGRLLVMFQPHGFGPLRLMRREFIETFARTLSPEDVLLMPEPVYFGGTTDRSVSSADIAAGVRAAGRHAEALIDRDACGVRLLDLTKPGDRIVIMGARDDTLTEFARDVLQRLQQKGETR